MITLRPTLLLLAIVVPSVALLAWGVSAAWASSSEPGQASQGKGWAEEVQEAITGPVIKKKAPAAGSGTQSPGSKGRPSAPVPLLNAPSSPSDKPAGGGKTLSEASPGRDPSGAGQGSDKGGPDKGNSGKDSSDKSGSDKGSKGESGGGRSDQGRGDNPGSGNGRKD